MTLTLVPAQGIKEVTEVTEAVLEVALRIVSILKDGYQPTDLALLLDAFAKDPVIKQKLSAAYDGISKIGGELRDLDVNEGIGLSVVLLQFIPRIIELLRKDK